MIEKILKIVQEKKQTIEEVSIEELLGMLSENEEDPPKELEECVNVRFLYDDDEFQYYGRIKTKKCKRTKNRIVKVRKGKVILNLPNLKEINGWEFKNQVMEKYFDWNELMKEFNAKKISSWRVEVKNNFQLEEEMIYYNLKLIILSNKELVKTMNFENLFEKKSLKLREK